MSTLGDVQYTGFSYNFNGFLSDPPHINHGISNVMRTPGVLHRYYTGCV